MTENNWSIEVTLPSNSQLGLVEKVINTLKKIGRVDCTHEDSGEGTTVFEQLDENNFFTVVWTKKRPEEVKKAIADLTAKLSVAIKIS